MEKSLRPQCLGLRAPSLTPTRTSRPRKLSVNTHGPFLGVPKRRYTAPIQLGAIAPRCLAHPLKISQNTSKKPSVAAKAVSERIPIPRQANKILQGLDRMKEMYKKLTEKLASSSEELKAFLPMTALFFFMAFVNTIVSNLSMSLVITAQGGGAGVIPYLTAYVAFPLTLAATVLYTYASHFMSRRKLFTITVGIFAAFNLVFALCLYPNHELLHLPGVAETLSNIFPSGFDGAVGMVRNWTFSLFYCLSEMWGDMGITLLFWGFANDITTSEQAPIFYPLMGIGANIAQTLGGVILKMFSAGDAASVGARYQGLIFQIVGCMMIVMVLHRFISGKTNAKKEKSLGTTLNKESKKPRAEKKGKRQTTMPQLKSNAVRVGVSGFLPTPMNSSSRPTLSRGRTLVASFREPQTINLGALPLISVHKPTHEKASKEPESHPVEVEEAKENKKKAPSFKESLSMLRRNPVVLSLGWMTIAQALSITLMEFVWKSHLKLAYPTAAAFSAFMGDIAASIGILTGACMFLSPILFKKCGWTGVARITPFLMTIGGGAFFVVCSAFHIFSHLGMTQLAQTMLPLTVVGGAFIFVLSRGTKFSLFKPSEEMVYINMDEEERMKGKAAVDVVGASMGKSGGSILQQALLLASGGRLLFITPIMFGVYMFMMRGWNKAVTTLSTFQENKTHEQEEEQQQEQVEEESEAIITPLTEEVVSWDDDRESVGSSVVEFLLHSDHNKEVESHPVPV